MIFILVIFKDGGDFNIVESRSLIEKQDCAYLALFEADRAKVG